MLGAFTFIETICPRICSKSRLKSAKDHFRLTSIAQKRWHIFTGEVVSHPSGLADLLVSGRKKELEFSDLIITVVSMMKNCLPFLQSKKRVQDLEDKIARISEEYEEVI